MDSARISPDITPDAAGCARRDGVGMVRGEDALAVSKWWNAVLCGVCSGMTKAHSIRLFALIGAAASGAAYVGFVMVGLNEGGAQVVDLWETLIFASPHVILAWTMFAALGTAAYVFREKVGQRLLIAAVVLLGLPVAWAAGLRFLYYSQPGGWWPGFDNEIWRWMINHVYAEFSLGLMIGFLGLVAVTLGVRANGN